MQTVKAAKIGKSPTKLALPKTDLNSTITNTERHRHRRTDI